MTQPLTTSADVTPPRPRAGVEAGDGVGGHGQTELLRALEHEMAIVVRRIRRVIAERARAVDPSLQPAGYLVLSYLADSGPSRGCDVVDSLGIDKGAISRHVQHLVDLGLVVREPDPADGRAHRLSVTGTGRQRLEIVAAERLDLMARRLDSWSAADLTDLVDRLAAYNQALDDV